MSGRQLAFVLSRMLGIWFFSNAFLHLRQFLLEMSFGPEYRKNLILRFQTPVAVAFFAILAYVLWVHADWVSKLVAGKVDPVQGSSRSVRWEALAYGLAGLYLFCTQLPQFVSSLEARFNYDYLGRTGSVAEMLVTLFLLILGILLMIGKERLLRTIYVFYNPWDSKPPTNGGNSE